MKPPPEGPGGQRISDDAVRRRTGRGWQEWFAVLDAAGARDWDHRRIVAFLVREYSLPDWWCQMVAVTYEQARGLREPHQTAAGYQVSAGKTVAVPLARLYRFWVDEALRQRWLPDVPLTVRRTTPDKSLRITWPNGSTKVDVNFYAKGPQEARSGSSTAVSPTIRRWKRCAPCGGKPWNGCRRRWKKGSEAARGACPLPVWAPTASAARFGPSQRTGRPGAWSGAGR